MIADRTEFLVLAGLSGWFYALVRLSVLVCLPVVASQFWQRVIGPELERRWPGHAQSEDDTRPSYMPIDGRQPYVVRLVAPADGLAELGAGFRDGFLLGVLLMVLPELFASSLMLTLLLAVALVRAGLALPGAKGPQRVDLAYFTLQDVALYACAVWSAQTVGLLNVAGAIRP